MSGRSFPDDCKYAFKQGDMVQSLIDHQFGEGVEIRKGHIYEIEWAGRTKLYDGVKLRGFNRDMPILASRFVPYDIITLMMPNIRDYYQAITEDHHEQLDERNAADPA